MLRVNVFCDVTQAYMIFWSMAVNVTLNGFYIFQETIRPSSLQVLSILRARSGPLSGGEVSARFVWPLARGQSSAPTRFHKAGGSVRGIKDEASWRMARLLLLGRRGKLLYIWQQEQRTRRGVDVHCHRDLHCSCLVYRLLMEGLVPKVWRTHRLLWRLTRTHVHTRGGETLQSQPPTTMHSAAEACVCLSEHVCVQSCVQEKKLSALHKR